MPVSCQEHQHPQAVFILVKSTSSTNKYVDETLVGRDCLKDHGSVCL